LSQQGWNRQDTVSFLFPDSMEREACCVEVEVRAVRSYPYADLWLALIQSDSLRNVLHVDTLRIDMTDDNGIFTGRGLSFLEYSSDAVMLVADSAGKCSQVSICHLMNRERINGVTDVGVRVSSSVPAKD
ncbi:MAG: hypothetical protein ACI4UA_02500, partial [Bacteroidaceae bacterium]